MLERLLYTVLEKLFSKYLDVDVSKLPCGLNGARRSENTRAWSVPPLFSSPSLPPRPQARSTL